jgi:TIR domain
VDTLDALRAIQRGEKPDQETILRLHHEGLIDVVDVTHLQSPNRECIPGILTAKGLRLLEGGNESATTSGREPVKPRETTTGGPGVKRWDVFISHAGEDQEEIAHPLADALREHGFEVWYAQFSLKLGDSLRESINRGLAESRFGVVILSKHFFAKHWTNQELNGLAAIEVGGENVILPVWHGVTQSDVVRYSPILADRRAITTEEGIERIVAAIEEVVRPPLTEDLHEQLYAAEEVLQEYRCPHCAAPLSTRSSVRLSEDDDGIYEDFQCGYAHIDGDVQHPCPSDPKFPKLEDYAFTYQEVQGDPLWKWRCFAAGKTKEARQLSLTPGLGRTQEEARRRVEESYNGYAKPWTR